MYIDDVKRQLSESMGTVPLSSISFQGGQTITFSAEKGLLQQQQYALLLISHHLFSHRAIAPVLKQAIK